MQANPEDLCLICGTELELSDGLDGRYYVYCSKCGDNPKIINPNKLNNTIILGYPLLAEKEG